MFDKITDFLNEEIHSSILEEHIILFLRPDGIPIFFHDLKQKENSSDSIGALMSGTWRAASELRNYIKTTSSELDYRMGYDTSSSGMYVLPIAARNDTYLLGALYSNVDNPALLKLKLRYLASRLEEQWMNSLNSSRMDEQKVVETYLFENITDREMDELFSFAGNL